jgi:hypothetical protein
MCLTERDVAGELGCETARPVTRHENPAGLLMHGGLLKSFNGCIQLLVKSAAVSYQDAYAVRLLVHVIPFINTRPYALGSAQSP